MGPTCSVFRVQRIHAHAPISERHSKNLIFNWVFKADSHLSWLCIRQSAMQLCQSDQDICLSGPESNGNYLVTFKMNEELLLFILQGVRIPWETLCFIRTAASSNSVDSCWKRKTTLATLCADSLVCTFPWLFPLLAPKNDAHPVSSCT